MRIDATKIGEWGAKLLLKEMAEPANGVESHDHAALSVKPTLIVRGSTGPISPPGGC